MSGALCAWAVLPWSVWECWWLAPLALLLDLLVGDPRLPWPHPVCLVGRALTLVEGPARRLAGSGAHAARRLRLAGGAALARVCAGTGAAVWLRGSLPRAGGQFARDFAR
ncbi:MAG: cobalamin biosynthesis protein, partial [Desulfovibrio sp.]|nr:cobalamin biosynthesis protein [Desulfovibrio sp.]